MKMPFARRRPTDAEVVAAYRDDDSRIQRAWYLHCRSVFAAKGALYTNLSDYDRDDLFQDAFIVVWQKMESGQIRTGDDGALVRLSPQGPVPLPDLAAFFMGVVHIKYLERFHSRNIAVPLDETLTPEGAADIGDIYWDEDPDAEKDRIVTSCLNSLPASCLEILTKFYYEKKSLDQILAERPQNTSYDGLKTRKSKCMATLKKRIAAEFERRNLKM